METKTRKSNLIMQPNYKNWMPKGLVVGALAGSLGCLVLFLVFGMSGLIAAGVLKTVLKILFLVLAIVLSLATLWMWLMYRAFSYNGKRQMSRRIIEGVAERVTVPYGGWGLDVGCGSGALTIAVAKRNPNALITGIDRWGKEYASYSKSLCQENAKAEGVSNIRFVKGNALRLDFPDEMFDAVTSNYVYHNIPSRDRQAILLETLRVLKKGGTFAIHDIFSHINYGDMQAFVQKLKDMGYEEVELIPTDDGTFMTPWESTWMMGRGSAILQGKK
ncbi:MAG: class I SAM-dependent methyltransferase [Bacteroidales bacterium]|nr:class I SAM-dependent methyltransferase [Bacteroidales bacterium]